MRRACIAALVLLGSAGCDGAQPAGKPPAIATSASPSKLALPAVGMCHAGQALDMHDYRAVTLNPTDCANEHQAEIVRVGRLTTPPENKTREVYADCDTAAREYVGGDWHEGRLGIAVIVPSTDEWNAGAREYRCALFEFAADDFTSRQRTGSLKDGLRGTRPLALTCVDVLAIPDGQGWYESIDRLVTQACDTKAAAFLGESKAKFESRTDLRVVPTGGNPDRWGLGDRTSHCYVVTRPDNRVTKSLKGSAPH
ncbi:septum formation family protein [Dactylosporangium sp. CA-139114]|uniref:septum formation family protein n=1 Tax=Dactylosporangium sp. CA-139114 TaxID=3239931 RepID=UPI003D975C64